MSSRSSNLTTLLTLTPYKSSASQNLPPDRNRDPLRRFDEKLSGLVFYSTLRNTCCFVHVIWVIVSPTHPWKDLSLAVRLKLILVLSSLLLRCFCKDWIVLGSVPFSKYPKRIENNRRIYITLQNI